MKLSTKTRYGTRAMLDLALHADQEPLSAADIAANQEVSVKYLESLLTELGKAGLVRSVRGPGGGHLLTRAPEDITLREIFEVLEGAEGFVPCTLDPDLCDRADLCATQDVWAQVYTAALSVLECITLWDLVESARSKRHHGADMYYI